MNEFQARLFIDNHLENAKPPHDLFSNNALEIMAAFTRGNRRSVMNTATMALEKAYYHEMKAITTVTLYNSD